MKSKKIVELVAVGMLMSIGLLPLAQAQGGDKIGGGGNYTESDLRAYMGKIDTFLQSNEGKTTFPEIVAYDQAHPEETFHKILINTYPVIRQEKLKDQYGVRRDCVSHKTKTIRYFVCTLGALPEKKIENQPSMYRIVMHELLVQAGIEKPLSQDIPSEYKISYRITENVHLETYQEWVPGKAAKKNTSKNIAQNGWKITNANFFVESVLNVADGSYAPGGIYADDYSSYWTSSLSFHKTVEFGGKIVIEEYNPTTISHRTTVISNIFVVMDSYGLNFRLGSVYDIIFPLKGLKGKTISSIFDSTFYGGKLSASAGLMIFGVTPNYSFLQNDAAVRIPNMEKWIGATVFSLGLELQYLTLKFNTESLAKNSQDIQVNSSGASIEVDQKVKNMPIDVIKNVVIGQ